MKYEQALERVSHCKAPNFKGDIKGVLAKHRGWLNNEMWGSRADLRCADLSGTNLSRANLRCADLSGTNLSGAADLRWADFRGADLSGSDFSGADLSRADFSGADLSGADFRGADLSRADLSGAFDQNGKIKSTISISGAYMYAVLIFVYQDHSVWIRMGCKFHSLGEWGKINFAESNIAQFPNDGSLESERRKCAFKFAKDTAKLMADAIDWETRT